ncbi:MAG: hypothetical protein KKI09_12435 [Spirochaetes bacterium]|nr:hypothetical protein [Spirochaetota bacterium]MBU0956229.1 hypothetical protein [Spirochaetota bacterium]
MTAHIKLPKKQLYGILVPCALIVFAASLEVLFRVKDVDLYETWLAFISDYPDAGLSPDFSSYVSLQLMLYFSKLIIPAAYALYSYFAYIKIRINNLFVFIWTVLTAGSLAYCIAGSGFGSIFTYFYIAAHLVLFFTTISLAQVIREAAEQSQS